MKKWLVALFALVGVLLGSCGGGATSLVSGGDGGVGSGGTGISGGSVGYVSGFGSIYVNGTRYDIGNATLSLTDDTDLKLGMSVKVTGTVSTDFSTGTASSVESEVDARGQVSNISAAAGTLQLQGLDINTDSETVYDGVTGIAGLSNGDWVKVYGQAWGSGQLRASRIEKLLVVPSGLVLSGTISQLDKINQRFVLGDLNSNNLTINYGAAAFTGAIDASSISNGMVVRVRSSTAPVAGVLGASSIKLWYPLTLVDNAPLSVDGVIGNYSGVNSFKVLGYSVDASGATVTGGTVSTLAIGGVKVEVTGLVHNGILVASSVQIRQVPGTPGHARYTATGPIVQFVSASSFKVQGQAINASGVSAGIQAQLANKVKVQVVGSSVVNGVLIADSVTFN